jgi:hypothetical protein
MKKIYEMSTRLMLCLFLAGGLCMAASCDDDELSTDQMSGSEIILRAFGPNPVLRGGELRFIGVNLNKVTGVAIPGAGEVTDFTKKEPTDLRLTVPQSATEGHVTLHTPQGDITTKTQLTFEEPIEITAITATPVKAGDLFTITGDYLNLIAKVAFRQGVEVDSFISQSRQQIVVKVPREAQSGKVMVANGAEIPIEVYSEDEASVVLPAITELSEASIKAGAELTITGTSLDLVEKVIFGGGKEATGFTREGLTTIKVDVPADAQDGVVTVVAWSGVEVQSAGALTLAVPVATAVNPLLVKNGASATIAGDNLDLVTAILFGEVEVEADSYTINGETEIALTVPETASADRITLVAASGKIAAIKNIAYVAPTISSISPTSITAGEIITIAGANLDLVREVIFPQGEGTASVALDAAPDAASFTVRAPFTATGGIVTLKTVNGAEVASVDAVTVAPSTLPTVLDMPAHVKGGALLTVDGVNLATTTKIEFLYGSATIAATQFLPNADGTTLQVYTPTLSGIVATTLRLYRDADYTETPLIIVGTAPVTNPELVIFDFEDGLAADGRWGGLGQESTEEGFGKFYEIAEQSNWEGTTDKYWWFADNWRTHPSVSGKSSCVVKMDIRLKNDVPCPKEGRSEIRVMLSGQVVNILPFLMNEAAKAWAETGGFWTTCGEWTTIAIPLTEWSGLSDPTPASGGEWGIATWMADPVAQNFTGFGIDNIRYEHE